MRLREAGENDIDQSYLKKNQGHIPFARQNRRSKVCQSKETLSMELKYKIGFHRKIIESNFISNLNQVIPDDITRDMTVFVGHVQAVSEYVISSDIQNIA